MLISRLKFIILFNNIKSIGLIITYTSLFGYHLYYRLLYLHLKHKVTKIYQNITQRLISGLKPAEFVDPATKWVGPLDRWNTQN